MNRALWTPQKVKANAHLFYPKQMVEIARAISGATYTVSAHPLEFFGVFRHVDICTLACIIMYPCIQCMYAMYVWLHVGFLF